MSIESLIKIVRPPTEPVEGADPSQWAAVEARLGTALPEDYMAFAECFGSGTFDDFILPFTPTASSMQQNLFSGIDLQLEARRLKRMNHPYDKKAIVHPFALYPEPNGLLVWGSTASHGDYLYWHAQGHPNQWKVVLYNLRDGRHQTFDQGMTDFLASLCSRSIHSNLLPHDFPGPDPVRFVPARARE
jgi:hypothetical protein